MMSDPKYDDLDDLFADVRKVPVAPSDALMARVLGDAAMAQPKNASKRRPEPNIWMRMMDAIGGWPSVGSLAAATVAGIWVGVAPPTSVQDFTASFIGDEVSLELMPTSFAFADGDFVDG